MTIDAVDGQVLPIAVGQRPVAEDGIVAPLVADIDMLVVFPAFAGALPHAAPDVVQAGSGFSVPVVPLGGDFAIVAATGFGVSSAEVGSRHDEFIAAGASTEPMRVFVGMVEGNDGEPPKGLANHRMIIYA